jgi:hypothetical protein
MRWECSTQNAWQTISKPFKSFQKRVTHRLLRATSTAVAHSSSGIGAFPFQFCSGPRNGLWLRSNVMFVVLLRGMAFLPTGFWRHIDLTS